MATIRPKAVLYKATEMPYFQQEIFLQAYRKIGSFKRDAAIGTWLAGIGCTPEVAAQGASA